MTDIKNFDKSSVKLEWIPVRNLAVVWPEAQRPFKPKHAKMIAKDFDPDKFEPVKVMLPNGNGIYHICEGQHRTAAVREALGEDQSVPCLVAQDEDPARAAEIFLGVNADRDSVSNIAKFLVSVTAGRKDEVAINRIVRHNGYQIDGSHKHNTIAAVSALAFVYGKGGKQTLERTLSILRQTWGGDPNAVASALLRGYGAFICEYSERVDWKRLAEVVRKKFTPGQLVVAIKSYKENNRVTGVEAAVEILKRDYNKSLPKDKRLRRKSEDES